MRWTFDSPGWAVRWGNRASSDGKPSPVRPAAADPLAQIRHTLPGTLGAGTTATRLHLRVATARDAWALWDLRNGTVKRLPAVPRPSWPLCCVTCCRSA